MITPEQYASWPEPIEYLAEWLESYILDRIARSLKNGSKLDINRITREVSRTTGLMHTEAEAIVDRAFEECIKDADPLYQKMGITSTARSRARFPVEQEKQRQINRMTMAMSLLGFSYRSAGGWMYGGISEAFRHMQSRVSRDGNLKTAVRDLADSGVKTNVSVPITIVGYARELMMLAMTQTSTAVTDVQGDELQSNLREVSAHRGARDTGSGPENHKNWQGKVYWAGQRAQGYRSLIDVTGYGTITGLKGVNCRHDMRVYVEGVSIRQWTDRQLAEIDSPPMLYGGKEYTYYGTTKRQRDMERAMRQTRKRIVVYNASELETDKRNAQALLRRQREEYLRFSQAAGLRLQPERSYIGHDGGFSKIRA